MKLLLSVPHRIIYQCNATSYHFVAGLLLHHDWLRQHAETFDIQFRMVDAACIIRPIILDAELYTTCPGERVLVAIRFNVTFLPLRPY